jgi:hypothetical protein
MISIKECVERISDRVLGLVVPHVTADAACTRTRCCVIIGARAVAGTRLFDIVRGTACTKCVTNGSAC